VRLWHTQELKMQGVRMADSGIFQKETEPGDMRGLSPPVGSRGKNPAWSPKAEGKC